MTPRGIDRKTGYITYRSEKKKCDTCPLRGNCLSKTANTKTVVKHIWQEKLDEVERIRLIEYWSRYYPQRSRTIERVFADAKEKHGLYDFKYIDNYSLLEKAALYRESKKMGLPKINDCIKDEINNMLHINSKLVICLNPHKYEFATDLLKLELEQFLNQFKARI